MSLNKSIFYLSLLR